MNRIRAGFCHTTNPFSNRVFRVSLLPEDCTAIVFWTRNPAPLLKHLDDLNGYKYYFLYSLLGYGRPLESHNPSMEATITTFQRVSERATVVWRYDPIVISSITPPEFHLERFAYLARRLAGYTQRCTYSFISMYGKTGRNLGRITADTGVKFSSLDQGQRHDLLTGLARIAQANGMEMYSCCELDYLQIGGIQQGHCVDLNLLRTITGSETLSIQAQPTREHCGCVASADIGSYDTCLFGCAYCYATNSREAALRRHAAHDPSDTILSRPSQWAGIDLDTLIHIPNT